jgi:hypothetical protein
MRSAIWQRFLRSKAKANSTLMGENTAIVAVKSRIIGLSALSFVPLVKHSVQEWRTSSSGPPGQLKEMPQGTTGPR